MEPPCKKSKKDTKSRFVLYSDEDINAKHESNKNKNTTKTEERANKAFQRFLQEMGKSNLEYWYYDEEELDNMLAKFYHGAHKDPDSDFESDPEDPEKKL